jgi:biotin operon repressor
MDTANLVWGQHGISARQMTLLFLTRQAHSIEEIAYASDMDEEDVRREVEILRSEGLAIMNSRMKYRLVEPLSWHDTYLQAAITLGSKELLVGDPRDHNEPSHLFLCDIKNRGTKILGDQEILTVVACGRILRNARIRLGEDDSDGGWTPTCAHCQSMRTLCAGMRIASDPFRKVVHYLGRENVFEFDGCVVEMLIPHLEDKHLSACGRITIVDEDWLTLVPVDGYEESRYPAYVHDGRIRIEDIEMVRLLPKKT